MDYIKQLQELIKTDVLVEIEENLKELKEAISSSKKNKDLKEELKYMEDIKIYFNEILEDINNNSLTNEQALDIIEGLEDMKIDNQEV